MADPSGPVATAVFFDGQSNRRRAVALRLNAQLEIVEDGFVLAAWGYGDLRQVDAPAGATRLWSAAAPPLARLEIRDPALAAEVLARAPNLTGPGGVAPISVMRIATWSLAAAAAIGLLIWFGVPFVADQLAEVLPARWERPLGEAVDKQVRAIFPGEPCTRPEGRAALAKLIGELQSAAQLPIPPEPVVLNSVIPNAFALPGGRVYILSALLARAKTPDELAGVLAHEFGHVSHRDGLRRLIRDGGTGFLAGLLFGDVSGAWGVLFGVRSILSASYSRDLEAGADGFAIGVMHRLGRPTAPLGDLLLRIDQSTGDDFSILRDHPLTPERAERLRQEDGETSGPELLTESEWKSLRTMCR